jgi:hypothetical protein
MKRSGPPARRTPLRQKSGIKRVSPAVKAKSLLRSAVTSRRPAVTPEERKAKKILKVRSQGICEVCGRAAAQQAHHRKKAGREWTPENLLHVCGLGNYSGCHGLIEQNPTASKEQGWWLEPHQNPARAHVWLAGYGYAFLTPAGDIVQVEEEAS